MVGNGDQEGDMTSEESDLRESEELAFDDNEESLPWLESDEEEEPAAFDASRLVGIGLMMVLVLILLVGAIWWLSNRPDGSAPEPDGSLIAAPEEPYKTRPEDAGGKTFEGTGDTSFAVGEGQTREGRLADAPIPEPTPTNANTPAPAATQATNPRYVAPPRGTAVQVGAFPTRAAAESGWRSLIRQTDALSGVEYRIVRAQADIGTVHRLQAAAGSSAAARQLCDALKADGLACLVK